MKIIGIYKITNPKKQVYIGQSNDIKRRFSYYKRLKCESQPKLYNSFKKYGVENHFFEVLTECDLDKMDELERYYQELFNVIKQGLNCKTNPLFDRRGQMSDETKKKISKAHMGKTISAETRLKLRNINLGRIYVGRIKKPKLPKVNVKRVVSEEQKEQIRKALTGRKRPEHIGKKIGDKLRGRKLSEEVKRKISLNHARWNMGLKASAETRVKMSLNSPTKRRVIDTVSKKVYRSILEASIDAGIDYGALRRMVGGKQKNKTNIIYF